MIPFLVIGCGNIGALYDIDNEKIQTHAKAIHLDPRFSLAIHDPNKDLMLSVADKYKCDYFVDINKEILEKFSCISICAPTKSHVKYILDGIGSKAELIICEKPVSNDQVELEIVMNAYLKSSTKIMVNYMRRFQPVYCNLKKLIRMIRQTEHVRDITIQYHRGFLNNCSHAFDLIEFLFDEEIVIDVYGLINKTFDHFQADPTVTFHGVWNNAFVNVIGLSGIKYSFFQIEVFFETYRIGLYDSGNTIKVYKVDDTQKSFQTLSLIDEYTQYDCLQYHMLHVIDSAFKIVDKQVAEDNFIQSIELNKRMLNLLNG